MTLPFKAVAVDMDGTFLDDRKQFDHQRFNEILTELEKRNIHFIVASGRPYARLKQDFEAFAQRMDFVTLNGSRLISNDQEIFVKSIQRENALSLIKEIKQKYGPIAIMVFEREIAYLQSDIPKSERDFLAYFAGKSATVDDFKELPQDRILQLTFNMPSFQAAEIEQTFNKHHSEHISAFASAGTAIDINAENTSKATGLRQLLTQFGLTGDDLIAFGDGGNDIPMLDFAQYSYAMANGMEKVKKHAKFIAPPNTDGGVFKVLEEYLTQY